jgi:hypothetical protein
VVAAVLLIASEFLTWVNYASVGDCCSIPQERRWQLVSDILFVVVAAVMLLWAGYVGPTRWAAGVYLGVAAAALTNFKFVESVYAVVNDSANKWLPAGFLLTAGAVVLLVAGAMAWRRAASRPPAETSAEEEVLKARV